MIESNGTEAYYATVALLIPTLAILLAVETRAVPSLFRFVASYKSRRRDVIWVSFPAALLAGGSMILTIFMLYEVPAGEIHSLLALYRGHASKSDSRSVLVALGLLGVQIVIVTIMRLAAPLIEQMPDDPE